MFVFVVFCIFRLLFGVAVVFGIVSVVVIIVVVFIAIIAVAVGFSVVL